METEQEQWKALTDIPNFDFSGKTPWELGMSYSTWKRQLCTVAGTASGKFQSFVEACVAEAEMRYQCKAQEPGDARPGLLQPLPFGIRRTTCGAIAKNVPREDHCPSFGDDKFSQ